MDAVKKPAADPANRHMTGIMMIAPFRFFRIRMPLCGQGGPGMVPHRAEGKYVFDMGYASRKFDERKGDDARLGRFWENGADDERDHAHMLGCIGYCHGL